MTEDRVIEILISKGFVPDYPFTYGKDYHNGIFYVRVYPSGRVSVWKDGELLNPSLCIIG